jgi:hypothetical protein
MHDEYRWTDHVISPRRLRVEFIATVLIVALVGGASLADAPSAQDRRVPVVESAIAIARAPGLAAITKPRFLSRGKDTQC